MWQRKDVPQFKVQCVFPPKWKTLPMLRMTLLGSSIFLNPNGAIDYLSWTPTETIEVERILWRKRIVPSTSVKKWYNSHHRNERILSNVPIRITSIPAIHPCWMTLPKLDKMLLGSSILSTHINIITSVCVLVACASRELNSGPNDGNVGFYH